MKSRSHSRDSVSTVVSPSDNYLLTVSYISTLVGVDTVVNDPGQAPALTDLTFKQGRKWMLKELNKSNRVDL